jgi:hypothetical protein
MANDDYIKKILIGKKAIMEYAGLSNDLYKKFKEKGMPILIIDGRCYAHKDNIDDFFKTITRVNSSKIQDTED